MVTPAPARVHSRENRPGRSPSLPHHMTSLATYDLAEPPPANPWDGLPPIYYDASRKEFLRQAEDGTWLRFTEAGIKRELKIAGVAAKAHGEQSVSDLDLCVSWLVRSRHVAYAGPLAGHRAGLTHADDGQRVLVTDSPHIIDPQPGKFPLIYQVLAGLFPREDDIGTMQRDTFCAWLKIGAECVRSGIRQPGQALAVAGPVNSGKTLLATLITWALGGRSARPYRYMSGECSFNAELFQAEAQLIDDEAASRDGRVRAQFAATLKQFTVSESVRCEAKYQTALSLRPLWRVVVTLNDEPEALGVLPPLNEDIHDKLILLRAQRAEMPMPTDTPERRAAFGRALREEMPAFLHYLAASEIPAALASPRFGVRHFHHPELAEALADIAPERRLLALIDAALFAGPAADEWEGTALELERLLTGSPVASIGPEARKLLSWDNACGTYLGRLRRSHPKRFEQKRTNSERIWSIKP
ncbi:MAG: ATP-binding protein [Verrucomicrobia bacterium]|nr:ATP-binding protein [Verrucomicrobiota bacterium]